MRELLVYAAAQLRYLFL